MIDMVQRTRQKTPIKKRKGEGIRKTTRKFGGKTYRLRGRYWYSYTAKEDAKAFRKKGYNCRITKTKMTKTKPTMYWLWVRRK